MIVSKAAPEMIVLTGDSGDDSLIGGPGGDSLAGGTGNDIYHFAVGDGQDTISDASGIDRIEFGAGISPDDVRIAVSGAQTTLVVTIGNGDDRITITNGTATDGSGIESFRFADGTIWNSADIVARWQTPTSGADIIVGTAAVETLAGGAGHDRLIAIGSGDTLLGEAGDDTLVGTNGADILVGGAGHDTLLGGLGDDIYRWGRGQGSDTLTDTGGVDRIEIDAGVAPSDIRVYALDTTSLMLRMRDTGEELKLVNILSATANVIESIIFADGTVWSAAELRNQSFIGLDDDEIILGTTAGDRISGNGGADTVNGLDGDDDISGGDGADILNGGAGADRLAGDRGDDVLSGGAGADTYVFAVGDGADQVRDGGDAASDILRIEGYTLAQMRFGARGDDLVIRFANSPDRVIVRNGLGTNVNEQIETFAIIADGVQLSLAGCQGDAGR